MNTIVRKQPAGSMPHGHGGKSPEYGRIPGRPVQDPMNHLDAEEGRQAEHGTENPYFGESDPGKLPHLQHTMHIAKTRRWIVASSIVFVVSVVLGAVLIPMSEAMAAAALAVGILLYGLAWIFRMFLEVDHRRTILLASIVGLQMLLVLALALLVATG